MNRSAVRIRPPAPQNPLGKRAGFLFSVGGFLPFADASMRPARLRVQINRCISAIPSRYALLTNPPTGSTSSPQGNSRRCPSFDGHLAFSPAAPLRVAKMPSRKCKTFAVLLVPTELPHCSLIFAPRGGFAAFLRAGFLFSVGGFLPFADASMRPARLRVQINRRISAIPSRYALLTNPPTSSTSSPQGNSRRCPSFDGHLASAAPLRVAKMQDIRRAPRSYGTTAPPSHFCCASRLCRFFMIGFLIGHEQNRPVADASMRKNRTLSLSGRRNTCRDRRTLCSPHRWIADTPRRRIR